jgi:hypothetical protein
VGTAGICTVTYSVEAISKFSPGLTPGLKSGSRVRNLLAPTSYRRYPSYGEMTFPMSCPPAFPGTAECFTKHLLSSQFGADLDNQTAIDVLNPTTMLRPVHRSEVRYMQTSWRLFPDVPNRRPEHMRLLLKWAQSAHSTNCRCLPFGPGGWTSVLLHSHMGWAAIERLRVTAWVHPYPDH